MKRLSERETGPGYRFRFPDRVPKCVWFRMAGVCRPAIPSTPTPTPTPMSTSVSAFRSAAYNVFPFIRDTGVCYSTTHRCSIFPLFLLWPAMRRVNDLLSLCLSLSFSTLSCFCFPPALHSPFLCLISVGLLFCLRFRSSLFCLPDTVLHCRTNYIFPHWIKIKLI